MDYDPESDPQPLDKPAQKRAVDAVLIGTAVLGAVLAAFLLAPGLFDLPNAQWIAWGALALAGAVHAMFQLHYLMRFMWGRGEYVTMTGPDWGEHGDYFTALLIVTASAIVIIIALAGLNTLLGGG